MAVSAPVDVKGAVTNTLTAALSGLTNGGSLVLIAAHVYSTTAPTLPAGYTNMGTVVGTGLSFRVHSRIAAATTDSGGTNTSATVTQGIAFNGASTPTNFATNSGTGTSMTFPALTASRTDGTSTIVRIALHGSSQINNVALTNYTVRDGTGASQVTHNVVVTYTRAGVTSNPTADSVTVPSGNWATMTIEIPDSTPAAGNTGQFFAMF